MVVKGSGTAVPGDAGSWKAGPLLFPPSPLVGRTTGKLDPPEPPEPPSVVVPPPLPDPPVSVMVPLPPAPPEPPPGSPGVLGGSLTVAVVLELLLLPLLPEPPPEPPPQAVSVATLNPNPMMIKARFISISKGPRISRSRLSHTPMEFTGTPLPVKP